MDLTVRCRKLSEVTPSIMGCYICTITVELEDVKNFDEIVESLVDECDPASLVTSSNRDGILDYIGIEYVMKYFDLKQEKEDYGMRDSDFM